MWLQKPARLNFMQICSDAVQLRPGDSQPGAFIVETEAESPFMTQDVGLSNKRGKIDSLLFLDYCFFSVM